MSARVPRAERIADAVAVGMAAGMQSSIGGVIGAIILCFLVRNSWHRMPWGLMTSSTLLGRPDPVRDRGKGVT